MTNYKKEDDLSKLEFTINTLQKELQIEDAVKRPSWQYPMLGAGLTLVTNTPEIVYLQRLKKAIKAVVMGFKVNTAGVGLTWGELALYTGQFDTFGTTGYKLYKLGYANIATELGAVGSYTKEILLEGTKPDIDIWAVIGFAGGTAPEIASTVSDTFRTGLHQAGNGRPSLTQVYTTALPITAKEVPWILYQLL